MSDLTLSGPSHPSPGNPLSADEFCKTISALFVLALLFFALLAAEHQYDRAVLCRAYRRRHHWNAGDRTRLKAYPLSARAARRAERATGRGRPVVPRAKSFDECCTEVLSALAVAYDPAAAEYMRCRALKTLPVWPQLLEAMYQGERLAAKAAGQACPQDCAEEAMAQAFGMSTGSIRKLCTSARKQHSSTLFEPMTLAELWDELDTRMTALVAGGSL